MKNPRTFAEVWAEKERAGYQYGPDALEGVRFGWRLCDQEYRPRVEELEEALADVCRMASTVALDSETAAGFLAEEDPEDAEVAVENAKNLRHYVGRARDLLGRKP